jgi:DNA-binding beta-propeller fold protein YncE
MNLSKGILTVLVLSLFLSCATTKTVSEEWTSPEGLMVPESVYFDQENVSIYVSNINGQPTEKNMNGFISRLTTDGQIETLKWISGINAPKGMGVFDGKLYVTDIDRIHIIDIKKATIIKTLDIEDAMFLNDIAIDMEGRVYISDLTLSRISILEDGVVRTWIDLNEHKRANGLFMEKDDLMVGTTSGLVRINLKSRTVSLEIPLEGGIDGLKSIGDGFYVVSDWKGKIQKISTTTEPLILSDTSADSINAADFEYIEGNQALLIPTFFDNNVNFLSIK